MSLHIVEFTPLQRFLISLLIEINTAREATSSYSVDYHSATAQGMVYAALTLKVISLEEFERLTDLAIEAADYRRCEHTNNLALYTWTPAMAKAQEAAA
ncbi:hypothetical protein [Pseudomonas sp. TMP9]|uniref:hypothetical protein n=1 Tax=Pseudomonas sp. TMP9 TaxID=3133144 RepID=UPI0030D31F57